jgi:TPP-dependent pyruvate/acetoin dehydrogenase alpha subunit
MTAKTKAHSAAAKALAGNHGFSLISDQKLLDLYTFMLKIRLLTERMQPSSGSALGLEATAVGVAIDLLAEDTLLLAPRQSPFALLKSAPLERILELQQKLHCGQADSATSALAQWNVLTPSASNAALLNTALGVALANKIRDNDRIAVAIASADSAQDGSIEEAMTFASLQELPILFILQHEPTAQAGSLLANVKDCGFPIIPVDGDDVVAIYRVATESIARIRQGRGPTLIECLACPATEAQGNDPIVKMERYLSRKGLFREEIKSELLNTFGAALDEAIASLNKLSSADTSSTTGTSVGSSSHTQPEIAIDSAPTN